MVVKNLAVSETLPIEDALTAYPNLKEIPGYKTIYNRGRPKYLDSSYTGIIKMDHKHKKPLWETLRKLSVKYLYNNSILANKIIENPGGEASLHEIYDYDPCCSLYGIAIQDHRNRIPFWETLRKFREKEKHKSGKEYSIWDHIFLNLRASGGARRRKDEYQNMLQTCLQDLYRSKGKKIIFLEGGSGRGDVALESIANLIGNNGLEKDQIEINLADVDRKALKMIKDAAEKYGLSENTNTFILNLRGGGLRRHFNDGGRPHEIGLHGVADYFPGDELYRLIDNCAEVQEPGSYLVITHMTPHKDYKARLLMHSLGRWAPGELPAKEFLKKIKKSGKYEIKETRIVNDSETHKFMGEIPPDETAPQGFFTLAILKRK
jgi:hypothetical protein